MCYGCWEEEGKPSIVNEKTKAAAALIEELYEEQPVGGYLHIVTDDMNCEQGHIDYCVESMDDWTTDSKWPGDKPMPEPTDIERRCGAALQDMTDEERTSSIAIWEGWIDA